MKTIDFSTLTGVDVLREMIAALKNPPAGTTIDMSRYFKRVYDTCIVCAAGAALLRMAEGDASDVPDGALTSVDVLKGEGSYLLNVYNLEGAINMLRQGCVLTYNNYVSQHRLGHLRLPHPDCDLPVLTTAHYGGDLIAYETWLTEVEAAETANA